MQCSDPTAGLYYLSISRDRVTLSSYNDDAIRERVEKRAGGVPGIR
jgi:hypothetical protein